LTECVLLFGGTFDPVHVGHLSVAAQAREMTGAGSVWFVPARVPPLHAAPLADAASRLALLRAALEPYAGFRIEEGELQRDGPSYTIDTLTALRDAHAGTRFSILLGADAARSIPRWHRAKALLKGEDFVIVNRTGRPRLDMNEAVRLGFDPSRTVLLEVESPDASASDVRRRVAAGESISGLVPAEVAALIDRMGLYHRA